MVVQALVEAQAQHVRALVRPAGDAHRPCAMQLGDLPHQRPDRAGGGGDHHGLPGLGLADVEHPAIGSHARHPQDAQRGGRRRRAGRHVAQALHGQGGVFLPAGLGHHQVPGGEAFGTGLHDLADGAADHDGADLDRGRVGWRVAHAPAHVGVQRQPPGPQQHLARRRGRHRRVLQPEGVGRRGADGTAGQDDAGILGWGHDIPRLHGRRSIALACR